MVRSEALYLRDILNAAETIRERTAGATFEEFFRNGLLHDSVLYRLVVIGEAASKLSPDLRGRYGTIDWGDIIGFRNFAVHAYFALNLEIVWATAIDDLSVLTEHVAAIMASEYGAEREQTS